MIARPRPTRRTLAPLGVIAAMLLLASCSSTPRGGAESLPTAAPADAAFTDVGGEVPAPAVSGRLVDGTSVELADLWQDRAVVLQFTATWCTQCQDAESELAEVIERYDDAALLVHVALDEPVEDIRSYLDAQQVIGPVLIDANGTIWRDYAVAEPPLTAVIATDGTIVRMWPGGATADEVAAELDTLID
jgi:thiol-disulfide isomerase/thioredoxin